MAATGVERLRYYQRQYLGALDFEAEQAYHRDMRRRHNVGHHTWGIVTGLELVESEDPAGGVLVHLLPGLAIDGFGREILVLAPVPLEPSRFQGRPTGLREVWIRYREERAGTPAAGFDVCDEPGQRTRLREGYEILIDPEDPRPDKVVVDGRGLSAPARRTPSSASAPTIPVDASVPYQELPAEGGADRWPVRIGSVNWDAAKGEMVKPAAGHDGRVYAGVVGAQLLAPGGQIVVGNRATTPKPPDKPNDLLVAIEGRMRVDGRLTARDSVQVDAGKLELRDRLGGNSPALELYRRDDEGVRVRLGDAGQGKLALSVGTKDGKDFAAAFVVNDKGEVTLNSRLEIRKAGGVAKPSVRLERADGLNVVIGDSNTSADRLAVGPEVAGTFEPKLTVSVDGTATIAGNANVGGNARVAGTAAIVGATTVGTGGSSPLHVRHIEGKNWQNDDPDHLFLNWISGRNVHLGQVGKRSSLFVAGDAVVGSGNDGFLATRHLRGKLSTADTPDTLYVNYGTGKNVVIGAPGATTSALQVSGDVTVGAGGNGSLRTRHIDGKSHLTDDPDDLHLNWGTGKNVVIGNPSTAASLVVHGVIWIGGDESTDPLSIERFKRGTDQTDLRIVVGDNTSGDDRLVVGPRPFGQTQVDPCLTVVNDGSVATKGKLTIGGSQTRFAGLVSGAHQLMIGNDSVPALTFKPSTRQIIVNPAWELVTPP
jgi:hypothetical protein